MNYLLNQLNYSIQADFLFDRASFYYKSCSSTNDMALNYLLNAAEGTIFITEHQYRGKGQRGNIWESEVGKNLLFSLILYPEWLTIDNVFALNVITSLAIYDVLVDYSPKEISIKWPNDIYYLDQKLGGILIETTNIGNKIRAAVVGIGLNVNQLYFESPKCVSLAIQKKTYFDRALLLTNIIDSLSKYYTQLQDDIHNSLWEKYLHVLYRNIGFHMYETIHGSFEGRIVTVNKLGELIIEARNGKQYSYKIKEIIFV